MLRFMPFTRPSAASTRDKRETTAIRSLLTGPRRLTGSSQMPWAPDSTSPCRPSRFVPGSWPGATQ